MCWPVELSSHALERPDPRSESRCQGQITELSVCCSESYRPLEAEETKTIARHFPQLKKLCFNPCHRDRTHVIHAMNRHRWDSSDTSSHSS